MRFPDALKFSVEDAQAVNLTPHNVHDSRPHDAAFREPIFPSAPVPQDDPAKNLKRLYVRQADLDLFGYTPGCARCDHTRMYGKGRTQIAHSDACRLRIYECLKGTPEGQRRLHIAPMRRSPAFLVMVVSR